MVGAMVFWVVVGLLLIVLGVWTLRHASSFTSAPWWWRPMLWQTRLFYGSKRRQELEGRLASPKRVKWDGIMWIVGGIIYIGVGIIWWIIETRPLR